MLITLIHFLSFTVFFFLLIRVLEKDNKSLVNRSCAFLLLLFCLWSFCLMISQDPSRTYPIVALFSNIASISWATVPAAAIVFIYIFTEQRAVLENRLLRFILIFLPVLFVGLQFSGMLAGKYVLEPWGWRYVWANSIWPYLYYLYIAGFLYFGFYKLASFYYCTGDINKKKQTWIIFWSGNLSFFFAFMTDVVLSRMNFHWVPNLGPFFITIFAAGLTYAITKYKMLSKLEEQLVESTAQIEDLYNNAPCGYHSIGPDGTFQRINNTELAMYGYSRDELIGKKKMIDILTDESKKIFIVNFPLLKEKGFLKDLEFDVLRKDGTVVSLLANITAIYDKSGDYISNRATIFDNTARKKVEEELRRSENKYRVIFENSQAGMYRSKIDGSAVLDINSKYCEILGYTKEEILTTAAVATWADPEKRKEFIHQLSEKGSIVDYDADLRAKDGKVKHCLVSAVLFPEQGILEGTLFDITERKKSEEELRASRSFLDSIVENIPNMVFVKDARELRFRLFNKAGEDLLGYSRDSMYGKNDYDFFPKDQAEFFIRKDREVLDGKTLLDIPEEKIQTKDKGERVLHTKKIPVLDEKGGPEFLLGISEDITERKKAEEELKKTHFNLDLALDASQIGVWELDLIRDTSVRDLRHDQIFGYKEKIAEWGAKIFFEHIIAEDRPSVQAAFDRAMETCRLFFECRIFWPDGSVHWITATGKVMRDNTGKPHEMFGTVADITDRKEAEEKLKQIAKELQNKVELLEKFQKVTVDRELKMKELKEKIKELEAKLPKQAG